MRNDTFVTAVGYDGQAYVEHLDTAQSFTAERPDGSACRFSVPTPDSKTVLPTIGPIPCH